MSGLLKKIRSYRYRYLVWIGVLVVLTAALCLIDIPAAKQGDLAGYLAYLERTITRDMQKRHIGGVAIGLIQDGKIVHLAGYGYADAEKKIPVREDTVFQVASVSKSLTAWGVMKLVEEGKLELDAPVSKYLTRWSLPESRYDSNGVTIRRLLSHSSGIAHVGGYAGFETQAELQTLEESLTAARDAHNEGVRISYPPGTEYRYSGGGYTLLQLVIEGVTGLPFETYMKNEILTPLHMDESSFVLEPALAQKLSVVYGANGQVAPSRFFTARAAAGLYTTAKDLSTWALAMMPADGGPEGVLAPGTLQEMFRPQPGLSTLLPYGLGYMIQEIPAAQITEVAHTGSNLPGWNSLVTTVPEKRAGLVVLTNSPGGGALRDSLRSSWFYWVTGRSTFSLRLDKLFGLLTVILPLGILGIVLLVFLDKKL